MNLYKSNNLKFFLLFCLSLSSLLFAQRSFTIRYTNNLTGNIKVIGNTVLQSPDPNSSKTNASLPLSYVNIDIGNGRYNSSSATIEDIIDGVNLTNAHIKWAGLYWQGYLHNDNEDTGADTIFNNFSIDQSSANTQIHDAIMDQSILFKVGNAPYTTISPTQIDIDQQYNNNIYVSYKYAAFADVTELLKNSSPVATYTVANIPTRSGRTSCGNWKHNGYNWYCSDNYGRYPDGLGNYGAWALVIVYDNSGAANEKVRNITVFDGYTVLSAAFNPTQTINLSGFRTPKYAANGVDSTISIFAGEGDRNILGDYAKLTNQDGYSYNLPDTSGAGSYFASVIEGVPNRNPVILNNNGIDIHTTQVGTLGGNNRPIKTNQTHASITLGTTQDTYMPSMVAFATELYTPKVCYDYTLRIGQNINIPSQNRNFSVTDFANEPLQLKLMIRSQEADFDLIDAKLSAKFIPDKVFKYLSGHSKYSPPNTYIYLDAIETDSTKGEIAIGENPTHDGGTIRAKETTYAKLYYDFLKPSFKGSFDIFLDAKISFDGISKVPYTMSTQFDSKSSFYIRRCDTNPIYNPVYGTFNIERGDSTKSQTPAQRYSLYTQVVGVPYSISVVSYGKDEHGKYTKEITNDATIELELIDGGTFDNNSSAGYDSVCDDPDTYNKGTFIKFNHKSRVVIDNIFQKYPTYPKELALKNAIFRTWVLTKDLNGTKTIVNHNCSSQSDSGCFETLYNNIYKDSQDKESKYCKTDCSSSSGTECYDCLREHFAMPICSRDNFAIRPNSYSIELQDANQTDANNAKRISLNDGSATKRISAGYLYRLETNATQYNSRNSCDGYYYIADTNSSLKQSVALFNDLATCTDKNNSTIELSLLDGKSRIYGKLEGNTTRTAKNSLIINNSGKYKIHIKDAEWTMVDHKGYKYKPFPNIADCIKGSNEAYNGQNDAKRGCVTQTNGATGTLPDLPISLHPYKFDLNSIALNANPNSSSNYIYINDLNSTIDQVKNGSVMALKLSGVITALGKNGKELSNYTIGCSADNLTVALDYNRTPTDINDTYGNKPKINYLLYDAATNDANTTPMIHNEDNDTSITMSFNKKYFYTPSKGSYNSYYNIARAYNNPINPFKLSFKTMNVSSLNEKISVDMQKNFIPSGQKDINSTKTLYFAKIKSKSDFYDDIYDDNVTTPIYVALYCNRSLNYCADYGIDTTKALTDEYDWWLSLNHNGSLEGQAILDANPSSKASVSPTPVTNFIDGVAKDVTVVSLDRLASNLPYIVYIDPNPLMVSNYPWLLYNRFNNTPPTHLYKVRFVDSPAAWSGKGKTGHTINVDSTGRKSNKVDW